MSTLSKFCLAIYSLATLSLLTSCGNSGGYNANTPGNLGPLPDPTVREAQIASEPKGNFLYARRYVVHKTRLWGYLREPGKSWKTSKLVLINEDLKKQPDRFPEDGPANKRFGFDQNYEYKMFGNYTGKQAYDPNSDLFLPVFKLTGYELVNENPGWIFDPRDYYDPYRVTLRPY